MFSLLFSLVALAPLALAAIHDISVGGLNADGTPNLSFWPNNIDADMGDTLRFTFHVKNHSVTQSSFQEPCSKLNNSYGQFIGFDSGFVPLPSLDTNFPTFEVVVNNTEPIWGYCRQINPPKPTHCQSGMVFAVNAPTHGNTFPNFLAMAEASTSQDNGSSSYTSSTTGTTETETVTVTQTETVTVDTSTSSAYWPDAPASTSAANPATHTIVVGGDATTVGFRYTPSNITANVGDKVFFQFMVKNHTVTQSSFSDPCRKLADTSYPSVQGFDSSFMPVAANATYFPNFTITVNDTNPIWGYCRQQAANFSHCGVGMVFSINANPFSDKSFAAFQQLAVNKNGSGFVDPFGNLTAPSSSGYGSGSSYVQSLDALGSDGANSGSSSDQLNKLLNTYAPAALGLLAGAVILLVVLLIISIGLLRRSSKDSAPMRSLAPSYRPVPLTMPSSKMQEDGTHDYEEPRYSDHEHDV
ncbi:hypothetical protein M0805_005855 [Coniferiporia weirii]|nr:hypothetical protein M0805_005855 [Coniferiporia weirii]